MSADPVFIAAWTAGGVAAGAAFAQSTHRLLTTGSVHNFLRTQVAATGLTAALFAVLAFRLGPHFDLLPYSYLAAAGVAASIVDIIEHRLPNDLLLPAYVVLAALFATSTIIDDADAPDLLRALAAAAALAAFHLALALTTRGGLGAGDVKLAGLLGMALGWHGWPTVITATVLAWLSVALFVTLRPTDRRTPDPATVPMGPFLLYGSLIAIILSHY